MTAAILLHCQRCGAETDSQNSREAICLLCVGREVIADDLKEAERLLRKRQRYLKHGATPNDEQIARIAGRARRRLYAVLLPQIAERILETLNRELGEQVQRELSRGLPIRRALPGDIAHVATTTELVGRV